MLASRSKEEETRCVGWEDLPDDWINEFQPNKKRTDEKTRRKIRLNERESESQLWWSRSRRHDWQASIQLRANLRLTINVCFIPRSLLVFFCLSLMYPIYISSWKIQLQEETTKRSTWTIEMALTTEKNLIARLSNFSSMSSFSSQLASCRLECPRNIIWTRVWWINLQDRLGSMGACEERVRSDENLKACSTDHSNMLWMKSCHVPETRDDVKLNSHFLQINFRWCGISTKHLETADGCVMSTGFAVRKVSSWLSRRMWRRQCESRENWFMPLGVLRVQLVHFSCCAQPHTECVSLLLLFFFHFLLLGGKLGRFIRTRSVYLRTTRKMLKWKKNERTRTHFTFMFLISHSTFYFSLPCSPWSGSRPRQLPNSLMHPCTSLVKEEKYEK